MTLSPPRGGRRKKGRDHAKTREALEADGGGPPKRLDDMTEPELRELMTAAGDAVKAALPPRTGYVVLAYEFGLPGIGQYIANGQRSDVIKLLRETADRLERRQEVGRVEFDD